MTDADARQGVAQGCCGGTGCCGGVSNDDAGVPAVSQRENLGTGSAGRSDIPDSGFDGYDDDDGAARSDIESGAGSAAIPDSGLDGYDDAASIGGGSWGDGGRCDVDDVPPAAPGGASNAGARAGRG